MQITSLNYPRRALSYDNEVVHKFLRPAKARIFMNFNMNNLSIRIKKLNIEQVFVPKRKNSSYKTIQTEFEVRIQSKPSFLPKAKKKKHYHHTLVRINIKHWEYEFSKIPNSSLQIFYFEFLDSFNK